MSRASSTLRIGGLIRFTCRRHVPTVPSPGAAWRLRRIATAGLVALATSSLAMAQPACFEIDPEHFSVGFLVSHLGYADVLGMFRSAKGSYQYDEKTGQLSDVRIEVETASVFTNHRKRDDHLKGPDFLNSKEFPRMVFTAASATRGNDNVFEVRGELELVGRKQPLTLQARMNKLGRYELGTFGKPYVMGVSARGTFRRSPYGISYGVDNGWVGDEVHMIVEFEARRQ
jgi:polyisoprenoid-binding protein YceI